jgi:hypothetical protein
MPHDPATLSLRLEGPMVADHRLPLVELERLLRGLRGTLREVAAVLSDQTPSARGGRSRGFVEAAANLRVVGGARVGSFELDLELPPPPALQPEALPSEAVPTLADDAVEALLLGLERLVEDGGRLPKGYDRGVLQNLSRLRPAVTRGVTRISLTARWAGRPPVVSHLDADRIDAATRLVNQPITAHAVVEGALRMVDHRSLECRIDRPPLPSVSCFFDEKDRTLVHDAARPDAAHLVRVVGEGEFPPGEREPRRVNVSSLETVSEQLPFDPQLFWRRPTLEALAEEQETSILDEDIDDEDPWRDDDEAAALIAAIRDT